MAIPTKVVDGNGHGYEAAVTVDKALCTIKLPKPPAIEDIGKCPRPLFQYLTDDGTSTGSNAMNVNGSSTNQVFKIVASSDPKVDRYIKRINIIICDNNAATMPEFGNLAALTNGVKVQTTVEGVTTELGTIKSNFELLRFGSFSQDFGSDASVGRYVGAATNLDVYATIFDFSEIFGLEWGLPLCDKSLDSLEIIVRDNLSAVNEFTAYVTGIDVPKA